jgi:hypothetical protein
MKKFLVVAFGTALATTAFAQQAPHHESHASHQQGSGIRPYEDDHYAPPRYERNNNANPDFQSGGER